MTLQTPAPAPSRVGRPALDGPWQDLRGTARPAAWAASLFGATPRSGSLAPWPSLGRRHRAQARLTRQLTEAVAAGRALRVAAVGLWCGVMRTEFERAVDDYLMLAERALQRPGAEGEAAMRALGALVRLTDTMLGCVGILDDDEALRRARDRAAALLA